MVQSAEDLTADDRTSSLDRSMDRRILAQVHLSPDHDVIEAFSADRTDQSLGIPVLPRRPWCNRLITDTHRGEATSYSMAIDTISISNEMVGHGVPRKGLGDLASDPLGGRMIGDAQRK